MKILLVEDHAVTRLALNQQLSQLGHSVHQAESGTEAWEYYQRETVPLIVSDWNMPGMDGLELCRRVRAQPQQQYTYFIMLTMRASRQDYRQAMAGGVDDFLSKEMDQSELDIRLNVAGRILGFAQQVRQLKSLLPICSYCKRIRDDADYWQSVEHYLHEQTGTDFSHGICPECMETKVKPEIERLHRSTAT